MTSTNATSSNTESDTATDAAWITAESVDATLEILGIPATGRAWADIAPLMRDATAHGVPVCLTGGTARGCERLWAAAALRHGHTCIALVAPTDASPSSSDTWPAASECGGEGALRHRAKCATLPHSDAALDPSIDAAIADARAAIGGRQAEAAEATRPREAVRSYHLISEAHALYIVGWLGDQGGDNSVRAGQALADLRGAELWPAALMATLWRKRHGDDAPIPVYLYCLERCAWLECTTAAAADGSGGGELVWRRRAGARPPPRPAGCYAVAGAPRLTVMAGRAIEALYAQAPAKF